jgi:hypothetical protein
MSVLSNQKIPPEIVLQICSFLLPGELFNLLRLSRGLWEFWKDNGLWREMLISHLSYSTEPQTDCKKIWKSITAIEKHRQPTAEMRLLSSNSSEDIVFDHNGSTFLYRSHPTTFSILRFPSEECLTYLSKFRPESLFANGELILGVEDGRQAVYKTSNWEFAFWLPEDEPFFVIGPNSYLLHSSIPNGIMSLVNSSGHVSYTLEHKGANRIFNIPTQNTFATADAEGRLIIWDLNNGQHRHLSILPKFDFTYPRGNILEVSCNDTTEYYHLLNEQLPNEISGNSSTILYWDTFGDGTYMIGMARDEDQEDDEPLIDVMTFSHDGKRLGCFDIRGMISSMTYLDQFLVITLMDETIQIRGKDCRLLISAPIEFPNETVIDENELSYLLAAEGKEGLLYIFKFVGNSAIGYVTWSFSYPTQPQTYHEQQTSTISIKNATASASAQHQPNQRNS